MPTDDPNGLPPDHLIDDVIARVRVIADIAPDEPATAGLRRRPPNDRRGAGIDLLIQFPRIGLSVLAWVNAGTWDFQKVPPDDVVTVARAIANVGIDEPARIRRDKGDGPNDATDLLVQFPTAGRSVRVFQDEHPDEKDGLSFRPGPERPARRGRPAGPDLARVARDFHALQPVMLDVRARQKKGQPCGDLVKANRWLQKLALSWPDATPATAPAWLRGWFDWSNALDDPKVRKDIDASEPKLRGTVERHLDPAERRFRFVTPGLLIPLAAFSDRALQTNIRHGWDALLAFEGVPLDPVLRWNDFIVGDYRPAELAAQLVAAFHARSKAGKGHVLQPEWIQKLGRRGRSGS